MNSESLQPQYMRRLRSFVRRDSRLTSAQARAHTELSAEFGLSLQQGLLHYPEIFNNTQACYLEIGFGNGQSLLHLAVTRPELNFIGIDIHKPGIGGLFLGIKENELKNLRVFDADAVEVLEKCIPEASLSGIQLFFPDPWPKRKHHLRRLIQSPFVKLLLTKLIPNGSLHIATDWEDYAIHIQRVLQAEVQLQNCFNLDEPVPPSQFRPIQTKFELRALNEGRAIRDFQFIKKS